MTVTFEGLPYSLTLGLVALAFVLGFIAGWVAKKNVLPLPEDTTPQIAGKHQVGRIYDVPKLKVINGGRISKNRW